MKTTIPAKLQLELDSSVRENSFGKLQPACYRNLVRQQRALVLELAGIFRLFNWGLVDRDLIVGRLLIPGDAVV
jgi:hypothetical protein